MGTTTTVQAASADADLSAARQFQPLIISGPPRSGTTLLYSLFDGHPDVFWLLTEGYFFEYLYDLEGNRTSAFLAAARLSIEDFVDGLRAKQVFPPLHQEVRLGTTNPDIARETVTRVWNEAAFREALVARSAGVREIADLWYLLTKAYAAALGHPDRPFACLKSPDFGKSAVAASRLIPEAKAVVIVRDPIRAMDSLKRVRQLRGVNSLRLTWPLLSHYLEQMNAIPMRLSEAGDRVCWLRYEDLVSNTEAVMRQLLVSLGLPFDPAVLVSSAEGQERPSNSSFEARQGIALDGTDRTLRCLTAEESRFVWEQTAVFREAFDYVS